MKRILKIVILLIFISIFSNKVIQAQTPQTFNWQFALRDDAGTSLVSANVSIKISIHEATETGTIVYSETFSSTTNNFGLINLQIGKGTPVTGTFSTINWGANSHFVQLEVDFAGGTTYEDMGTSQLASIPYALNAGSTGITIIPLGTYGGIALPQDISTCNAGSEGTIMYNTTSKKVQLCNGTNWQNIDGTQ